MQISHQSKVLFHTMYRRWKNIFFTLDLRLMKAVRDWWANRVLILPCNRCRHKDAFCSRCHKCWTWQIYFSHGCHFQNYSRKVLLLLSKSFCKQVIKSIRYFWFGCCFLLWIILFYEFAHKSGTQPPLLAAGEACSLRYYTRDGKRQWNYYWVYTPIFETLKECKETIDYIFKYSSVYGAQVEVNLCMPLGYYIR